MASRPAIAFFLVGYDYARAPNLVGMMEYFAKEGFSVDVYIYRQRTAYPFSQEGIRVIELATPKEKYQGDFSDRVRSLLRTRTSPRFVARLMTFLKQGRRDNEMFPAFLREKIKGMMKSHEKSYLCYIAVQAEGLLLAHLVRGEDQPLIYCSQSLYTEDREDFWHPYIQACRQVEKELLPACKAVLISDEERGELLAQGIDLPQTKFFYAPVGILGPPLRKKSTYLHEKFNLPKNTKILLHVGLMTKFRKSLEIAEQAHRLPPDWVIIFHGSALDPRYLRKLRNVAAKEPRFFLSERFLSFPELTSLVASASCGISLYDTATADKNSSTIGLSSATTAQYAQCGLPMILPRYPSFQKHVEAYRCGACIESPEEIPQALREIELEYPTMREGAFRFFAEKYDLRQPLAGLRRLITG